MNKTGHRILLSLLLTLTLSGQAWSAAPSITGLSVTSGPVGTSVTISGANFGGVQGTSTVSFNGTLATSFSAWGSGSITTIVPPAATAGPVVVAVGGIPSNAVTFTVIPVITSISPATGPINTFVTVTGSGFGASGNTTGNSTIAFNGTSANPNSWNITTIVVPVPNLATTGPLVVKVNGAASNSVTFTLAVTGGMSGKVTKSSNGTAVSGALVEAFQGGLQKAFTNTAADGTYSFAALPVGSYDVRVTAAGFVPVTSLGNSVTVNSTTTVNMSVSGPSITTLTPSSGPVGTTVTVSGSDFGFQPSSITFNGFAAVPSFWSDSEIITTVPSLATTGPVVVTVAGIASGGPTFTVGTGTITGTITRSSGGTVVSGALVEAMQSNVTLASATSGTNGTYSIANLIPGTYDVRISASGLGSQIAAGKSVTANSSITVNAALAAPGTDSGVVTKSNGTTAVPGATVSALQSGIALSTATTDGNGNFSMANLNPGTYTIQAIASGFKPVSQANVSVTAGTTTTTNLKLGGQSTITYMYDELGRLVGVNDSLNGTGIYNYDAVGNVVSIVRESATQVAIAEFIPKIGPTATSVVINGSGFSANPSQNTVKFNGTTAAINSSTATQIVTSVPVGAATGAISVTSPIGTATSSAAFTVTSAGNAPTITGFSPVIVAYGTPVNITGNNFNPTPTNNVVRFNNTFAASSSATSTTIAASVSSGAPSGHITVAVGANKAISSSDLYVVPPAYQVSNVGFTGRTTYSQAIHVALGTANQIGMVLFDGVAGQRASVQLSNGTFLPCSISNNGTNVSVLSPEGAQIAFGFCLNPGTAFVDTFTLHETGTYTVIIAPQSGGTGSADVTIFNVAPDIRAQIAPNGTATVSTGPGQNAYLTFSGLENEEISLTVYGGTYTGCAVTNSGVNVTILKPDGGVLAAAPCQNTGGTQQKPGSFIGPMILPESGIYTIFFDPTFNYSGSATIALYSFVNLQNSLKIGGPGVVVTTTAPGQTASLTFTGTKNQIITLQLSNDSYPGCTLSQSGVNVTFFNPDGTKLAGYGCLGAQYLTRITLPQTGTYTLLFQPSSYYTGSITLTLFNVVDVNTTITPGGSPVTVTNSVVGQFANLTFPGTANQRMSLNLTNGTYPGCGITVSGINVKIFNPDGTILNQAGCLGTPFFFDTMTLAQNGTYTIRVDPTPYTGSVTLTLYSVPPDFTGTVTIGGAPLPVKVTVPGQNGNVTFTGAANQAATVVITNNTMPVTVSLISPSGTTITSVSSSAASFNLGSKTLPTAGTYTIKINPIGTNVGSLDVNVTSP